MIYQFLNYCCKYSVVLRLEGENNAIFNFQTKTAACFGKLFNKLANYNVDTNFNTELNIVCNLKEQEGIDNLLVLSPEEVSWWLNKIQKIVPFSYLRHYTDKELTIKIKGTFNYKQLKFLCTISRIFFEYPENEIAKDVFDLKHKVNDEEINFKRVSALNLLLFGCELAHARHIHSLNVHYESVKPIRISNLIEKLTNENHYNVNNLFKYSQKKKTIEFDFHGNDITNESWRNTFNERVKQYKQLCKRDKNILYRGS